MNYEEFETFNSLAKSTIAELANIIVGKAITILNDNGYHFKTTPPVLLEGGKVESLDLSKGILIIPFECELGTFSVCYYSFIERSSLNEGRIC
jgi:chemotaxis protein CheX